MLFFLVIDIACFLLGIAAGMIYKKHWQKTLSGKRYSLKTDADWLLLMNYYPEEPTENLSLNKFKKGEKRWKKK